MNLFIYSDESGVFDQEHSTLFVYAGLVFVDSASMQNCSRLYAAVEEMIRNEEALANEVELKACSLRPTERRRLFKVTNKEYRFAVAIDLPKVRKEVFEHKKTKQRYLDYVFKMGVKRLFEQMIRDQAIDPENVNNLYFYVDQHTTATNGHYELKESLEAEFKYGIHSNDWTVFHPPIFPNLASVNLQYRDSKTATLIRAADIIANRVYNKARKEALSASSSLTFHVIWLP